jgi:hypothetical protein
MTSALDAETISRLARTLVEEARTDVVELWSVVWDVQHAAPSATEAETMVAALQVLHEACADGGFTIGSMVEEDDANYIFRPWRLTGAEGIARIGKEWERLGRIPGPGEIACFVDSALLPVRAARSPMGEQWRPG